jgi:hypothetical protein
MPPRSTTKQRVIVLLRELLTTEGFKVTESKLMPDQRTGQPREVDVVMEGKLNDVDLRICFEVVEHKRKATVPWVEGQLKKHEHLGTNKLYLVSWSGFTKDCEAVARAGGAELVTVDLRGPGPTLYVGRIDMRPTRVLFNVEQPDGDSTCVSPPLHTNLYSRGGELVGQAAQLFRLLGQPEVGRRFLEMAYEHPQRDQLIHFQAGLPLPDDGLHLRREPDGALHPIAGIELVGEFRWKLEPLDLHLAAFLKTPFAFGQSTVVGSNVLAVALLDALGAPGPTRINIHRPK